MAARSPLARARAVSPVLAFALVACPAFPAAAAEWFASPTGNDSSGTGTLQSPFRTVKRAISAARAGDTVTLRGPSGNNTYNECDVRLRVRLTLRSYGSERAHIHCDINTADSVTVQIDPGASGSRLSKLELSGGRYYAVMLQTNWYQGGPDSDTGASDVVLEDLLIRDTGRDGIKITPRSNRATIRRVEIRNTGRIYAAGTPLDDRNADGIDNVNGSGMLVEDSYIHDISTNGLYFKGGAADVVVRRNRIENTGQAGILIGFDTSVEFFDLSANPQYYEAIRGTVVNNFIRNTDYAGIGLYAAKDAVVANNTIQNAARVGHAPIYFGITFQDWDPNAGRPANVNPRILNNLVIQNSGNCIDIRYSNELGGLSGLSGAPGSDWNGFSGSCRFRDGRPGSALTSAGTLAQWRSATGADRNSKSATFSVDATGHLPANSPAINAGTVVSQVLDDIDGQSRSGPYDIGADEVGGGRRRRNTSQPLTLPSASQTSSAAAPAVSTAARAVSTDATGGAGRATLLQQDATGATSPAAALPAARQGATVQQVRIVSPVRQVWGRFVSWLRQLSEASRPTYEQR